MTDLDIIAEPKKQWACNTQCAFCPHFLLSSLYALPQTLLTRLIRIGYLFCVGEGTSKGHNFTRF